MPQIRIASNLSRPSRMIRSTTKPFRICCLINGTTDRWSTGYFVSSFHYALTNYSPATNSQRQTVSNHPSQLNGPLLTQFACRNQSMCVRSHFPIVGVWCNTHSRRKSISNFNEIKPIAVINNNLILLLHNSVSRKNILNAPARAHCECERECAFAWNKLNPNEKIHWIRKFPHTHSGTHMYGDCEHSNCALEWMKSNETNE